MCQHSVTSNQDNLMNSTGTKCTCHVHMCVVYSEKKSFRVSLLGKLLAKYVINKNV